MLTPSTTILELGSLLQNKVFPGLAQVPIGSADPVKYDPDWFISLSVSTEPSPWKISRSLAPSYVK